MRSDKFDQPLDVLLLHTLQVVLAVSGDEKPLKVIFLDAVCEIAIAVKEAE